MDILLVMLSVFAYYIFGLGFMARMCNNFGETMPAIKHLPAKAWALMWPPFAVLALGSAIGNLLTLAIMAETETLDVELEDDTASFE